jgi:hypothetical protein
MINELRHLCLIYEGTPAVHLGVICPFLLKGLRSQGRAAFVGSPSMVTSVRYCLANAGVDIEAAIRHGALVFISDRDHLQDGRFDPDEYLSRIEELYDQTMAEGFSGLWGVGDVTWEFGAERNLPLLLEYETALDKRLERLPELRVICQYRRNSLPLHYVGHALLSHRMILLDDPRPRRNPFFTPPEPVLSPVPTDAQVEQMLDILRRR